MGEWVDGWVNGWVDGYLTTHSQYQLNIEGESIFNLNLTYIILFMISHNNEGKTTNPNQRPFFKGVTDLFKKGGTTIGEKFTSIFKQKATSITNSTQKFVLTNPLNNPNAMSVPKSNFNIQLSPDDEKENVYHLNEDDDDFEDYEHIEGETEVKEEKEKKKENSNGKSKEETNGESAHPTIPTDIHAYCHRILPKGTLIDIAGLEYAKFTKVKAVGNLFSMIGVVHKREIEKGYLAYFDESYLYFIKDIEVDKTNPNMRAIGNRFNLKLIQNAGFNNMNDDKWKVVMIFLKEYTANKIIQKELIFDQEQVEKFYSLMNSFFVRLGLQMSTSDGEEDNFEEEDEEA